MFSPSDRKYFAMHPILGFLEGKVLAFLMLTTVLFGTAAFASPPDFDLSFNGTGKTSVSVGAPPSADFANAIALQGDGKILVAGQCNGILNVDFCAARFTPTGGIDTTFRNIGSVITAVSDGDDKAIGVHVQRDNKIVLVGNCDGKMCVVRYESNGSLDVTFNSSGKSILTIPSSPSIAYGSTLDHEGRVLVVGWCGISFFCIARVTTSGILDTTFNGVGYATVQVAPGNNIATSVVIRPDGKILLGGYCFAGFCAARFNEDGTLDSSFGGTGVVLVEIVLSGGRATSASLSTDGKLVVSGYCADVFYYKFCAVRLNDDGSIDVSFNTTGKTSFALVNSGHSVSRATQLLPDGKLLMAGYCDNGANDNFCMVRLNTDGSFDKTFSPSGFALRAFGGVGEVGNALVIQSDGKFLIAGKCSDGFCVARFEGGPKSYRNCAVDVDGDGRFVATSDALILARIGLGLTGEAVTNGISFAPNAARINWTQIRKHLVSDCGLRLPN
jgi:uncharacterized delta-60 repeat protein